MQGREAIEALSFVERVVLLTIAEAETAQRAPVASMDIKSRAEALVDEADAATMGRPDEPAVMRALGSLGAEPYIVEDQSETTPTGKGRPRYALDTDPETVFAALRSDDRIAPAVESVQN